MISPLTTSDCLIELQSNHVILNPILPRKNILRYPIVRDIEVEIHRENVVRTSNSLQYIHCIRDTDVQDTEGQLNMKLGKKICLLSIDGSISLDPMLNFEDRFACLT